MIDFKQICNSVAEILSGPSGPRLEVKFTEGPYCPDGHVGWCCNIFVNHELVFKESYVGENPRKTARERVITSVFAHGIDAARKNLDHLRQQIQAKQEL